MAPFLLNSFSWGWIKRAALVQQAHLGLLLSTHSLTHTFPPLRSSGVTAMSRSTLCAPTTVTVTAGGIVSLVCQDRLASPLLEAGA